jgi:hypothetical protein
MNCIIEFSCEWNQDDKIKAIRALRIATRCLLSEGKRAVEGCAGERATWRMTPAQFGIFMGNNLDGDKPHCFYIGTVSVIEIDEATVDFSAMPTA